MSTEIFLGSGAFIVFALILIGTSRISVIEKNHETVSTGLEIAGVVFGVIGAAGIIALIMQ